MDILEIHNDANQLSNEDKTWAAAAHFSTFLNFVTGLLGIIAPLVIFLMKKDNSPYIRQHAAKAFNFQICMLILYILAFLSAFLIFFFVIPLIFGLAIANIVSVVRAGIAAQENKPHKHFFYIPFIK
jgi:uncharacterized Tic20 family protein